MKKTIAILLVLVIGMSGVFAAVDDEAVLNLTTIVPVFDEIILTSGSTYTWGNPGVVTDINNDLAVNLLNVWDTTTAAQELAYVHARSNRTAGFKVTAKATALAMNDGSVETPAWMYIGYVVVAGDANVTVPAQAGETALTGNVMTVSATDGSAFASDSKLITVKPAGSNIDYKQGTYTADITFIVEAN